MTDLMIRDPPFLSLTEAAALALRPGYNFLDRILQIALRNFGRVPSRSEQSSLVQ
jgi:hypothetical protein